MWRLPPGPRRCAAPQAEEPFELIGCGYAVARTSKWSRFLTVFISGTATTSIVGHDPSCPAMLMTLPSSSMTCQPRTRHQKSATRRGCAASIEMTAMRLDMPGRQGGVAWARTESFNRRQPTISACEPEHDDRSPGTLAAPSRRRLYVSTDENKAVVRRWFSEVVSNGDMSSLDEICAVCDPAFAMVRGVIEPAPQGISGLKDLVGRLRSAFPDLTATVDEQVAEGDKVVSRVTMSGTHQGEFMGMPATGKSFTVGGASIWEVRGGQLISEWVSWDSMSMLQQLGVVTAPASPA